MISSLAPRAFWYLRHGQTDWNARGLSQGNVDIPLNAIGLEQARAAALALRHRGIARIVASPLDRARTTAGIVAEALGLTVEIDDGLREAAFGVQEGQEMGPWFADWIEGKATPAGGESFAELTARAAASIGRAQVGAPLVLVVAHGALFRALRAAMGLEINVRTANAVPLWCAPAPGSGAWTLTPAADLPSAA